MNIKVTVPSLVRKFTRGQDVVEVTGSSPIECLNDMGVRFPGINEWLFNEQGKVRPHVWLFKNEERIHTNEFNNCLEEGDRLVLLIAIAGG